MSTQNTHNDDFFDEEQGAGDLLQKLLGQLRQYWLLFVLSILFCLALAILYGKFAGVAYQIDAKIRVKDDKNSPSSKGIMGDMDLSSLLGGSTDAESEVELLTSRTLMHKVVKELQLNVTHGIKGKIQANEVADEKIPYAVQILNQRDTLLARRYQIEEVGDRQFRISNSREDIDLTVAYGQPIRLPQYTLIVQKKPGISFAKDRFAGTTFALNIESEEARTASLQKALKAELTQKNGQVINLTLEYPVPSKGEKILQALVNTYVADNLGDKQKMADSTLKFIDGQLAGVTDGLKGIESRIQSFKTSNELADMQVQSEELIKNTSDYYKKLNEIDLQLNLVNNIAANIAKSGNRQLVPNTLTVNDPVFIQYASTYNQLLLRRQSELLNYTEDNPIIRNIDVQLENARQNLMRSFQVYQDNLVATKKQLSAENAQLLGQVKKVPEKERVFLDYTRQQNLQQQLYLYLLQKRAETAISKTSTFSNIQVIDDAKSAEKPFKPKKTMVYLVGLIVGILLPFGFFYLKELLNTTITSKQDIEKAGPLNIAGEIGHNSEQEHLVIASKSRSVIAEQFRGLRTNLQFLLTGEGPKVIMVTSSMSGEGKSFISLNLANALAISNKKVALIELDLRKPKLTSNMGLTNTNGVSNYVISPQINLSDILRPAPFNANVTLISSGPIPPNPSELLLHAKIEAMMEDLKKQFDYVIIDTAPVGLVADALHTERFADLTLYVVRQGFTHKAQLHIPNDLASTKKMRHLALVVNDISYENSGYYGYGGYGGYGGSYGYGGYGGYADAPKTKKWFEFWK